MANEYHLFPENIHPEGQRKQTAEISADISAESFSRAFPHFRIYWNSSSSFSARTLRGMIIGKLEQLKRQEA